MWPDRRLLDLFKIDLPIVQAPMAEIMDAELVIAASKAGALGSLPCAALSVDKVREQMEFIGERTTGPINLNFFCHSPIEDEPSRQSSWLERLAPITLRWGSTRARPPRRRAARPSTPRCSIWSRS